MQTMVIAEIASNWEGSISKAKKIIFASSHVIYDKAHYLPVDEIHPKRSKTN